MIFFVIITCCIGIAGAAAFATRSAFEDDKDEEIESLKVCEGQNLSLSIQIESTEEDPQVFVTLFSNSSSPESMVAQLNCIKGECSRQCWRSEDSLMFDGQNMTLILMNVTYSRAGVYKVSKLSSTQGENKMYNLTVVRKSYTEPPLSSLSPPRSTSALYNISIVAGCTVVGILLLFIATKIRVFCKKS
ncbi:uncharacterized protein si:rp71-80o10.4 [Danio aesculapii]|uniref:uncharacterized protein si:rp71-80o10.4 n=1 Tax=Danio aesculapii TaxID=1142201 RepID=UPI0024C08E11|nr:uncharacterized protein si:rp71-80o10.4 [Danio aesculapii]